MYNHELKPLLKVQQPQNPFVTINSPAPANNQQGDPHETNSLVKLPTGHPSSCLAPVAVTQAYPIDSAVYIAQASEYDRYMRLAMSRDYTAALVNFRRALYDARRSLCQ